MSDDITTGSNNNARLGTEGVVWRLDDLYDGIDDPRAARDLDQCRRQAKEVEERFAGTLTDIDAESLRSLVERLEEIAERLGRISAFAFLNFSTQTRDAAASGFLQRVREKASAIGRHTVFFQLEWCALDEKTASRLLADPCLDRYRHYLRGLRRYAPHMLGQAEEQLLIEIAPVGRGAWNLLFEKVMGEMTFGEDKRGEEEVLADLYSPERRVRRQAAADLTEGLKSQLHVLTHITNTLLADKMIDDRLRGYPSWISSMNLYNELRDESVNALVSSVTERYDIVARYYRFKRGKLGLDSLRDYDRYAPLPNMPEQEIPWEQCRDMVLRAFYGFSGECGDIAAMFFERNWIHAPVLKGKRGGAFAHPCTTDTHPYVMVNYTGNIRDVSTVAHELGHGIHQYLAARQGYYNSDTPLVLAETASVFAELLLFHHQVEMLSDEEQRAAFIAQKLESIFATVFRQVAMNRFEDLTHTARRRDGELSAETISGLWMRTQQDMFGDSVELTDDYAVWWSYIPHFLSTPGYVYSYAFGELLVLALYNRYRQDKTAFVPLYLDLLAAGGSRDPYTLVAPFAIDLDAKEFWLGGLGLIEEMLGLIE